MRIVIVVGGALATVVIGKLFGFSLSAIGFSAGFVGWMFWLATGSKARRP